MRHRSRSWVVLTMLALTPAATWAGDTTPKAAVCAGCHGADGNSVNPEWPTLAGQHTGYLRAQITAFKNGSRQNPMMSPMAANLSDEDIAELADYFASKTRKPGAAKAELVATGEKLYRGGNHGAGVPACMGCHGPTGAGNPPAGYPSLSGQHAVYTARQLTAYRNGERVTDANAVMRTVAARLSTAEIEAVSSYLEGLH